MFEKGSPLPLSEASSGRSQNSRVPDREGAPGAFAPAQQLVGERQVLVRVQGGRVAVEDVVRALGAVGGREGGLHLEGPLVAEDAQHRADQLLLGLGLVGARRVPGEDVRHGLHRRPRLRDELLPPRPLGQRRVEVVVGEQPVVAVRPFAAGRLRRLHGVSIVPPPPRSTIVLSGPCGK